MSAKEQSTSSNKFGLFKQGSSPVYYIRIMHKGRRRKFSTERTRKSDAEAKARVIMADIRSRGWDDAIQIHGLRKEAGTNDPTIDEFTTLYQKVAKSFDKDLRGPTTQRYIRELKRICSKTGVKKISALTPEKIKQFKSCYLEDALKKNRASAQAKRTLNGILRNAGALFSKHALSAYQEKGLNIENPFEGSIMKGVKLKSYSPLSRKIIDKIWEESTHLRDGYSQENEEVDATLHSPHPSAYLILLLELGLGLRRNEADKAEWAWLSLQDNNRAYLEIRATDDFIPKSGESRTIPLQPALYNEIIKHKHDGRFIVPSPARPPNIRKPSKHKTYYHYRCDKEHKILINWLKWLGVDDPKPCHRLRKEFGSNVATSLSLYYAQKYLGHSTPTVTSDYYAALTDLPEVKSFNPQ